MGLVAIAVVVLLAFVAAWIVVEIALPLAFLGFYVALSTAIRRAARDRHDCAGHLGRAVSWAGIWSTLYLGPGAALIWGVHYALQNAR